MAIVSNGKQAITHVQPISTNTQYSYAMANLETGRTHQIRVHMASVGHPLVGDALYGPKNTNGKLNGQLLHAKSIGFVHPIKNEFMSFDKEEPEIFKIFLAKVNLD